MSEFDGLHLCEDCGDAYTTGRYCTCCGHQRMIDNDDLSGYYLEDESDPYNEYEDFVTETRYDPYHLFEELTDVSGVQRLLSAIRRVVRGIMRFPGCVKSFTQSGNTDDIPF